MKKYVRDILNDLKQSKNSRDFIPEIPQASTDAKTVDLNAPEEAPLPEDLNNQEPSLDPEERVRQLDWQAQEDEVRETLG